MYNKIKITVLGSGTSVGIPALGKLGWGKCNPLNKKNKRQAYLKNMVAEDMAVDFAAREAGAKVGGNLSTDLTTAGRPDITFDQF